MRVTAFLAATFFGAYAAGAAVAESEPLVLDPNSPWALDFSGERCSLARGFGQEGDIRFQIDAFGSDAATTFQIAGRLVPDTGESAIQIRLAFSPDTVPRSRFNVMAGKLGDELSIAFPARFTPDVGAFQKAFPEKDGRPPSFTIEAFDQLVEAYTAQVNNMTIEFPKQKRLLLIKTGNMAAPMAALRQCVDDLIKSWGLDPGKYRAEARRVSPLSSLKPLKPDFPRSVAYAGLNSLLPIRVMVDESGRAIDCVVQLSSLDEDYKKAVCRNFAGRYQPALDDAGIPKASFFQPIVIYDLPGRE